MSSINKNAPVAPAHVLLPITTPTRRRSNSAISSWAAKVQPGSPAPRSPRRRSSSRCSSRRPSVCSRRPSVVGTASPSVKEFDLTHLGYSSVFVHFPVTPSTPSPFLLQKAAAVIPIPPVPASPPAKRRGLKHFRSLSALTRPRSKSTASTPAMPALPTTIPPVPPMPKSAKPTTQKRKRPAPPPLANELALLQFTSGGTLESHAATLMARQAKAAGPGVGVGAVWRDGAGGVWWDEEEAWEYRALLPASPGPAKGKSDADEWVPFGAAAEKENEGEERRGSVSTLDSDHDARYLVRPADEEAMGGFVPLPRHRVRMARAPAAKHLHKPELFLVDAAFSLAGPAPRSPAFGAPSSATNAGAKKPKGVARRRPAPLEFNFKVAARQAHAHAHAATPSRVDGRTDFLAASFAPAPPTAPLPAMPAMPVSPLTTPQGRPRRLSAASVASKPAAKGKGLRNLFRRRD
ncbi:hypothetical protein DFH08DRAFT_789191 [Mycena albidolilacea]|uniref:Uncharacterized protein n=1 Tax=Mycena albidolilacea TaxID=1033008 RepID=A0AAD6ZFW8_9AGAR|nr:hypothetical protein DFH08DRAFT_789191 [Mycena albidolilacea]